ncbi:MAG: trypsin-like peptidase domain-containing protein [Acidobacteriota bacterium]|nr:trypsin-like peptidase domain-containing protein [Acidobacteriota bacterium]
MLQQDFVEAQRKRPIQTTKTLSSREIANKVLPSVVLIITQDENGNPISQGSGFVFSSGLVVSNLHVFERATNAIVKNVKTGEISKAIEVVGMNAKEDICVIRIDNVKFPVLPLGNSSSIQTGDEIYVASNPKGLEGSFTKGIVSGLRNDVGLFQIDAAISSGSSGGVLLNQKAEAVGIIKSSLVSGQNLNFAIPINKLKTLQYKFKHSIQLAGACAYKDKDKERLKGLVKTVTEIEPNEKISAIHTYDLDGNEIESTVFDAVNGTFALKFIFTYDENRLVTKMIRQFAGGQSDETQGILKVSINHKLVGRKFSGTRGSLESQGGMQVYNSNGEMTTYYIGGQKITFSYDSEGRMKESIQWKNEKIQFKIRYSYKNDEYGNWIEQSKSYYFPNEDDDWRDGETSYREITYYN